MIKSQLLDNLLEEFLIKTKNLIAAFVVDLDGLIISSHKAKKEFNEEIIGAIMAIVDQTISRVKRFAETSYGSGILDTNEFRLFYLELGDFIPAIFVMVSDPYTDIDKYVPYSYLVAEKVSQVLNENESKIGELPRLLENGKLKVNSINSRNHSSGNYVLIIGDQKAGKTSIIKKYTNHILVKDYKPTIGISIVKKDLQISKSIKSTLYLCDLGGLKTFAKVRRFFYESIEVKTIVIIFDYTREQTLENVNKWFKEADLFNEMDSVKLILVGNKIDKKQNRMELRQKAKTIAEEKNCMFYETSALTGQGIDELFMNIAF
jgi:small GTP-binding protein